MTAKTKWCILTSIQFTEQFSPCVVLSIHRNFLEAQTLAASLAADTYWRTKNGRVYPKDHTNNCPKNPINLRRNR